MKYLTLLLFVHLGAGAFNAAMGQWMQTNGPYGGAASSFVVHGSDLFVSTPEAGIFRSTDQGANWTSVNAVFSCDNVGPMISIGGNLFVSQYPHGLYRTTDRGDTWTLVNFLRPLHDYYVVAMAVNGGRLFAANSRSVYVSEDSSKNWERVSDSLPAYIVSLYVVREDIYVGCISEKVYVLRTGASKWDAVESTPEIVGSVVLNSATMFNTGWQGVLRSTDSGKMWISTTLSPYPMFGKGAALTVCNGIIFASTDSGMIRSKDSGSTWERIQSGIDLLTYQTPYVQSLVAMDSVVFAATKAGGIYRIGAKEEEWKAVNIGFTSTTIDVLNSDYAGLWASPQSAQAYHSRDHGETWMEFTSPRQISANLGGGAYCYANHDGVLYAGTFRGLWKSTNDGYSWEPHSNGWPDPFTEYEAGVFAIAFVQSDVIVGTRDGVYRSSDRGDHWSASNAGMPPETTVICFARKDSDLFAGTESGLFLSTDNGWSWKSRNGNIDPGYIRTITFGSKYAFACSVESGLYRSSDRGLSWELISSFIRGDVRDIASNDNVLFACASDGRPDGNGPLNGIIMSTNNGTSWTPINEGLNCSYVASLELDGHYLFASSSGNGVWRRRLSEILDVVHVEEGSVLDEPDADKPNHHFTSTASSFIVQHRTTSNDLSTTFVSTLSSPVSIDLFDVRGEHIARWHSDFIEAGSHNVLWTLPELSSGLYYVRLVVGSQLQLANVYIDH